MAQAETKTRKMSYGRRSDRAYSKGRVSPNWASAFFVAAGLSLRCSHKLSLQPLIATDHAATPMIRQLRLAAGFALAICWLANGSVRGQVVNPEPPKEYDVEVRFRIRAPLAIFLDEF